MVHEGYYIHYVDTHNGNEPYLSASQNGKEIKGSTSIVMPITIYIVHISFP